MRVPRAPVARDLLVELYRAAVAAAAPGPALWPRLQQLELEPERRIWILALGKAALPMASAAIQVLGTRGRDPAGGLVVAPEGNRSPDSRLRFVQGDHPEPGPGSLAAAEALGAVVSRIGPDDEAWVLLSGGTTSLIGAPEPGLAPTDLKSIYTLLLGSGLDITTMNTIRKRFSRWGGGKLARALAPARVRVYIVSDVIGDDLSSIGSGPCVPDHAMASEVRALLERAALWSRIPEAGRRFVASAESGKTAETPKAGDGAFERVALEVVASNSLALKAAAQRAAELGLSPRVAETPLAGEAAEAGARVARSLLNDCVQLSTPQPPPTCLIWGGETTVSLGEGPAGMGGRSQELALAAARTLAATDAAALLAAGTDGRDGPTDAAGAIIDGNTWSAIAERGRNPGQDLARHNAYPALDSVGALLRPGLTGTNVMDIVIGICLGKGVSG